MAFKGFIAIERPNNPPIKLNIKRITPPIIAFIISLLSAVVFCFMGCMLLYALQYWMLDRKLNLS